MRDDIRIEVLNIIRDLLNRYANQLEKIAGEISALENTPDDVLSAAKRKRQIEQLREKALELGELSLPLKNLIYELNESDPSRIDEPQTIRELIDLFRSEKVREAENRRLNLANMCAALEYRRLTEPSEFRDGTTDCAILNDEVIKRYEQNGEAES